LNDAICDECGLPVKVCNRIARLEWSVTYLAQACLELSKETGTPLSKELPLKDLLDPRFGGRVIPKE